LNVEYKIVGTLDCGVVASSAETYYEFVWRAWYREPVFGIVFSAQFAQAWVLFYIHGFVNGFIERDANKSIFRFG